MIKGIFIINNNGKARLIKCYEHMVGVRPRRASRRGAPLSENLKWGRPVGVAVRLAGLDAGAGSQAPRAHARLPVRGLYLQESGLWGACPPEAAGQLREAAADTRRLRAVDPRLPVPTRYPAAFADHAPP
jgi:hypothetical protein